MQLVLHSSRTRKNVPQPDGVFGHPPTFECNMMNIVRECAAVHVCLPA
jgi:hypothetical protein